jgi:hypothetical protein
MTSTTAKTGRNGKFKVASTVVARTTQWQVSPKLATSSEWGDSDGAGYTNRAAGRRDATFSVEGKYDTASEVFDLFGPGDIVTAALWMDATSLYWYFGRALNSEFSLTVNVDSEEVIGWSGGFGADGIFYYPGQAGAPAATL